MAPCFCGWRLPALEEARRRMRSWSGAVQRGKLPPPPPPLFDALPAVPPTLQLPLDLPSSEGNSGEGAVCPWPCLGDATAVASRIRSSLLTSAAYLIARSLSQGLPLSSVRVVLCLASSCRRPRMRARQLGDMVLGKGWMRPARTLATV